MIEIRNAYKAYNRGKKNQIKAIDHTSLTFGENGMVAILGASGCGKTTLLNVIGGLDKPNHGKIYVNGKRINSIFSGHTDNIRNTNIGYIFQNYHLMDSMTVFDNVALVLKMVGIRNKEEVHRSVSYVLQKVGLYKYRNRPVDTLSGGERQRVGIARAIVKNPGIIIADEPTGNLDSRNSLEIMNIIKSISRDKLVILVTHEKTLANFFADRIIEVVDGKVTNDYVNDHNNELDYRIDNKIYLQDMPVNETIASEKLTLNYVSDGSAPMNVRLVVKDGNIFIQCDGHKVDVVDSTSAVELVDEHYHSLTKEETEQYSFNYEQISHRRKLRYHHINNIFSSFFQGFKTVAGFSVIKKILLLGFVIASGFIMYSFSSYIGIQTVTDDEFISVNKNYVTINNQHNTVEDYYSYAQLDGVRYILPGYSDVAFTLDFSGMYYQTNQQLNVSGCLASTSLITSDDISYGRMPASDNEIVVDRMVLNRMIEEEAVVMLGIPTPEDFVGKTVYLYGKTSCVYTIVGVADVVSPCIYANDSEFENITRYGSSYSGYGEIYDGIYEVSTNEADPDDTSENAQNNASVAEISEAKGELTMKYGRLPENDYEVILNVDQRDKEHQLEGTLKTKVAGHDLTIVGFYKSTDTEENRIFANHNTLYYQWLYSTSGITLCCDDCASVTSYLEEQNLNVVYNYEADYNSYVEANKDTVRTTVIVAAVIMAIALIEIYLIQRSSFLSRIKEVGTLRAIGVKKSDIYCQFLGEVLAITVLTATPAFLIVGYILKMVTGYAYFSNLYAFNGQVIAYSILLVLFFNIIAGLLPVILTLRKTPAAILARTDVD